MKASGKDERPKAASTSDEPNAEDKPSTSGAVNPKLAEKKIEKMRQKYEKRGIVYISRLPPHMKPQKLRHLLEAHATLGRVYLAPEDALARKNRKQHGGNSGKNFTEGWVEFEDKADAKRVAAMLNGQPIGGKRRSAHYYDLWCLKYLPKFKWDNLTEEINYQKAIKDQRLAAEVSAAKRERDFYLSRVDKAKAVDAILERKKRKKMEGDGGEGNRNADKQQQAEGSAPAAADGGGSGKKDSRQGGDGVRTLRTYGQRKVKADPVNDDDAPVVSRGVLEMIAGKKSKKTAAAAQ